MIVTKETNRYGGEYWLVSWGPEMPQKAVCVSEVEAWAFVYGIKKPPVEPLVSFRSPWW